MDLKYTLFSTVKCKVISIMYLYTVIQDLNVLFLKGIKRNKQRNKFYLLKTNPFSCIPANMKLKMEF